MVAMPSTRRPRNGRSTAAKGALRRARLRAWLAPWIVPWIVSSLPLNAQEASPPAASAPGFADEPLERPVHGDRVLALERLAVAQRLATYGATEQAFEPLKQALAADPACVEALLLHARILLEEGPLHDPLAGLRAARLAALVTPDAPDVLATEGLARFLLGDSGRGRPLLVRCVALPVEQLPAGLRAATLEALAFLELRDGEVDAAAVHMEAAARLRPQRGYTRYGLAQVAGERGDPSTKLAELDAAVRLDPHLLVAWHERAQLLRRQKRDEEAVHSRRMADLLRELQDDTSARFAMDHAGKARRWLEVAQLQDDPRSWIKRWRELSELKEHATVASEGVAWLASHPPQAEVLIDTARAHARQGDAAASRATVARLADCQPAPPRELQAAVAREIEMLLRGAPTRRSP